MIEKPNELEKDGLSKIGPNCLCPSIRLSNTEARVQTITSSSSFVRCTHTTQISLHITIHLIGTNEPPNSPANLYKTKYWITKFYSWSYLFSLWNFVSRLMCALVMDGVDCLLWWTWFWTQFFYCSWCELDVLGMCLDSSLHHHRVNVWILSKDILGWHNDLCMEM